MEKNEKHAVVFKAFCDEKRLAVLELLQSGEKCACELLAEMDISQSTLSHHMKILCESGIVTGRRDGKWMYYSISKTGAEVAKLLIDELTTVSLAKPGQSS